MVKLPSVPEGIEPPQPRMSLREYARFSECCLHSNPSLTARNCLNRRTDEQSMKPFRLPARPVAVPEPGRSRGEAKHVGEGRLRGPDAES